MKDLEKKLREIPLREPSAQLDELVMRQRPGSPKHSPRSAGRLPVWAAAAVGIVMGAAGFGAGAAWRGRQPARIVTPPPQPVTVQVIYNSPASGNPFDFTMASDIFPAGKMEAKIEDKKGTES